MKPFGQPVTEIFDFEEGSRFAALTVYSIASKEKLLQRHRFIICLVIHKNLQYILYHTVVEG